MGKEKRNEAWLRGPIDGITPFLQPVAHALAQAREEVNELMEGFPDALLGQQVAGMASPAFHLQHLTGVLNRLFTYARGESLSPVQLAFLAAEGKNADSVYNVAHLVGMFNDEVEHALNELKGINPKTLTEYRGVGRAQMPSTVIGLYTHAAEHTMRHVGQLLVTVNVLKTEL